MNNVIADIFRKLRDSINCQLPCKITSVNSDGTVDVLVFRNDKIPDCVFPNVPVKHIETSRAYVFLGLAVGDRGVIRFFDRSVEEYKTGNEEETGDPRQHSFSDGLFEVGFVPSSERYSYPTDKTLEIGNKNGSFKLSFSPDGEITITTEKNVSMTCKNASITASADITLSCKNASISASQSAKIESPSIDLGGTGGSGVARIGDSVNLQTGKIISGSTTVRSL